ncbi:MAG: hypothetical protein WAL68_16430 [Candidatus Binatus sp.]
MTTQTPIEPARWRRSQIAETFASVRVSAPCYRLAEYIGFVLVVEPKCKLIEVQGQILFGHLVVVPNDPTLEQRPERFDGLRMNFAPNEFIAFVRDEPMRITDLL